MAGMMPEQAAPEEEKPPVDDRLKRLVDDDDETPNVDEAEQESYEDFVYAGYALIYAKNSVRPEVKSFLDKDPSDLRSVLDKLISEEGEEPQFTPMLTVAATAVIIVLQLMRLADDSDRPDDAVIFHGGRAIVEELAQIYGAQNKQELSQGQVNEAFAMAADLYREAAADAGLVNEEALKAAWGQIVAADKEGRLGEVLPQLEEINQLAAEDADAAPTTNGAPPEEAPQ